MPKGARPHHFAGIADISAKQLNALLDLAETLAKQKESLTSYKELLLGRTIVNLFYEPSTRTRASFSIAARNLGADVLDFTPSGSSEEKGEILLDTFLTLQSMCTDLFVVRHPAAGVIRQLIRRIHIPLVNAGDGYHEHPSQALLDLLTVRLHRGDTKKLKTVIVGDVLHSRVARSFIFALRKLGFGELLLVGPRTLVPDYLEAEGLRVFRNMKESLKDADVIMMLRLQQERMRSICLPPGREFYTLYGLSEERLLRANDKVLVMHPGPFNRGMEISSRVADSSRSLILKQVEYGVYARMAIFLSLLHPKYRKQVWG